MGEETFKLEQRLFTEADFERMSWHDAPIHAFAFGPGPFEISFDIDYLYRWLDPLPGEKYYRFWIGSATLVFETAYETNFATGACSNIVILGVRREDGKPSRVNAALTDRRWTFACVEGEISSRTTGYRQFARKPPVLLSQQLLTLEQRGGISFECPSR
jgi:hypothetical protein